MYQSLEDKIEVLKKQGDYQKALDMVQAVLVKNPNNSYALLQIADVYYSLGKFDKALKSIDFLLEIDKSNTMGLYVKGVINMEQGKRKDAKNNFKKAMTLSPEENPEMLRCYALTEYRSGNQERGLEYLEKAFTINDSDAEIIYNLIEIYMERMDYTKVSKFIEHYENFADKLETFGRDKMFYDKKIAVAKERLYLNTEQ